MKRFDLGNATRVHFIGIGGIGVSALARKFLLEGARVSGSDRSESLITKQLCKDGAKIFYTHSARHIPSGIEAVVYTKAIASDNPEFVEAKRRKLHLFSYSQALGALSKKYFSVAIAGSHGKTTTTGMVAYGLIQAKKDPTVVVGSVLKDIPSNYIAGSGPLFVMEACEYERSFLDLRPDIAVITNIDNDHLDCYKNIATIRKAFAQFIARIPAGGVLVANATQPNTARVLRMSGLKKKNIRFIDYSKVKVTFPLKLIGDHNIENAKAAIAVLRELGIVQKDIVSALRRYGGAARRFEYKGTRKGVRVYDDYAHHPTEVRSTLAAARSHFGKRRIVCVFQPHLYSRTKLLFKDFAKSFWACDELILLPIYAAREKNDSSISSEKLARAISTPVRVASDMDDALGMLAQDIKKGDLLITMGAGDVWKVGDRFLRGG